MLTTCDSIFINKLISLFNFNFNLKHNLHLRRSRGAGVPPRAARRPGTLRRTRNAALGAGRGSRKAPEAVGNDVEGAGSPA